ncbi:jg142 [Pararge aegeria aegeria]|uniref:Jg142 protein n=1 Tax=Pararge aegeria aegeria TaxID=348720 RepID=A0A8S4QTN0_9NEOP|nr:jg142 [Pararge aegeria aegeria]
MANANGYNSGLVDSIIKKKQQRLIAKELYAVPMDKLNRYKTSLTYFGSISERVAKILRSHGVHVAFRTNNQLRAICNGKDRLDNKHRSGVYKLQCSECHATYVGQTGRKFEMRYKEHIIITILKNLILQNIF